ncbi:MAG: hypothetical protein FJX72_12695 [Armatimonadetes bacterium]|nr:hypothetical protein [Armatimonadota bacterium]
MNIEQLERLSPGDWFHDVRDQLKWHVYRRSERAFAAGDAARDALYADPGSAVTRIRERQGQLRERFIASLGGLPNDATQPEARVTGAVKRPGFAIEKLIYESRPGNFVTALLYVPDQLTAPAPAVLFLCGHAAEGKAYPEYQRVCQLLALSGFVVLAQDPIGQGERLSYWDTTVGAPLVGACTLEHDHAGAQCGPLGWSPARFFLHDARRSLDYLVSRPEVDPSRIGLTGNSGGGTQSCLLMLTDERIAAAAPGTFIMNRQTYMHTGGAQDCEQIWPGFTAHGYDHEDVLIAMAPRPVCVLSVTDDFFPIEGTRRTVERSRRAWSAFGVDEMPELVVDRASHAYTPALACAAARFFGLHLMGDAQDPDYEATSPLPAEDIRCTKSGQVRGDFAESRSIHDACAAQAGTLARRRNGEKRGERASNWLRRRVRDNRAPCELHPKTYFVGMWGELAVRARVWWTQPDLLGHGLFFAEAGRDPDCLPCTIALWDGGTNALAPHSEWIRATCRSERSALVLDVSGMGALEPHPLLAGTASAEFYGVIHKLADDLVWLDDSLCALRTYDVLRATDLVMSLGDGSRRSVRIYADARAGRQCIYGHLAAMLDERVQGLDSDGDPPKWSDWVLDRMYDSRHIKAVILPGALEWFDIGEG